MDVKKLLTQKLKTDVSYPFKFDKRTGYYFRTDQITLIFPAGTSLAFMQEWVTYLVQKANASGIIVTVSSVQGYDNGQCIVTGTNVDKISLDGNGKGTVVKVSDFSQPPPKNPTPVVIPPAENIILSAFIGVDNKMQLFAVPKNTLETLSAKQLTMEK